MIDLEGEELNVEACIQFTLLQKILIRLAKREKENQYKIEELGKKLSKINNNNDLRFQNIENNIINLSENKPINKITEIKTIIEDYDSYEEPEKKIKKKSELKLKEEKEENYDENENESYDEKEINNKKEKEGKKRKKREKEKEKEEDEEEKYSFDEKISNKDYDDEKNEKKERRKDSYEDKGYKRDNKESGKRVKFHKNSLRDDDLNISHSNKDDSEYKSDTQEYEIERIISNLPNNFGLEHKENEKFNDSNEKHKIKTFPELLTLFNKRIHNLEKNVKELYRISKVHNMLSNGINRNKESIEESNNEIENLKKNVRDLEIKAKQSKNEMDQIKIKVEDFNIYDLFKDNGDGNLDASKLLIKNLEKKVFKKFDQNDEKTKFIEEDLFKSKNDSTNAINAVNNILRQIEDAKKSKEHIIKEFNELKEEITNSIKNMNDKITSLGSTNVNIPINEKGDIDENKLNDILNYSLKDLEEKIMKNTNDLLEKLKLELINANKGLSEEDIKTIKEIKKNIHDIKKELTLKSSQQAIDEINEKIHKIHDELNTKTNKYTFEELNDKVNGLEDKSKEDDYQMEQVNEALDKLRQENSMIVKRIEFLTGQYSKMAFGSLSDNSRNKNANLLDLNKFVDINRFTENNKNINLKIDHLKTITESIQRTIDDILERLKHTPTEDDFSQYQNLLKAMLEDLRLSCSKRYADKIDVQKSFRFIETQMKNLQENYKKEGETWLLAKKPISNFLCASCESVIKDMSTKNEYVPWNKYPQREEGNKYRMGHGFSRMLQLVNTDLLKTQESKESGKNYASDDEKINNLNVNEKKIKLPQVSHRGISNLNVNNSTVSINVNTGGNNNNNNNNNNNVNLIKTNSSANLNNNLLLSPRTENNSNITNDNANQPKVVKIYKINKNNNTINTNHTNNTNTNSNGNFENDNKNTNFYNSTDPNK